jgi:aspartate/methionine/tyrosine aminotransferase
MFTNNDINFEALKRKAYNGRWATLEEGIIPLTAADPDFRMSKEIENGIIEYIKDGYLSYGPFSGLPEFKKVLQSILIRVKKAALRQKMCWL